MGNKAGDEEKILNDIKGLLRRQQKRFKLLIETLDDEGVFDQIQDVFEEVNRRIGQGGSAGQKRAIELLSRSARESLIARGVNEEIARDVERIVTENWLSILQNGREVNLREVLRNAVADWEADLSNIQEREQKKDFYKGANRLSCGGGAVLFDAAKFLMVDPIPNYMFSSFIGGAILFLHGVDQLWGENEKK
jgi:hypothetical protein